MRSALCFLLAATWTFAQEPASRPTAGAVLTGRVMTGEGRDARPVRRARVTLAGPTGQRVADTDTKGIYRFDRIGLGEFKVTIEKPGFIKLQSPAPPDAVLTMTRGAAIEGTVTDGAGETLSNVLVAALHAGPGGKPVAAAQTRTDDLGRYRLHSLAGGEYWIEAATDRAFISRQVLMEGERPLEPKRAYHPAAATIDAARVVRVAAPSNTSGIDVMLVPDRAFVDPASPPAPPRDEPSGTGRVFGRIVAAGSGKPIAGARILLVGVEGTRLTNWRRSDSQGRFEYTGLEARNYDLTVQADGYVGLESGRNAKRILVKEADAVRADVTLPRAPAIEGILLDEFGEPAPGVIVMAARRQFVGGRRRLIPFGAQQPGHVTDDRGHYRLAGLVPDDYYLVALSGAFTEQNAVGGFAPTFYPGTIESAGAMPVPAASGADAIAATFPLVPVKTVSLSGTMVDAAGNPVGRGVLWLATPDRLKRMDFHLARGNTGPDGTFTLRNVPPGMYTLQGFGISPPGSKGPGNLAAMPFGWLPVSVGDADLDGVVLKVTSGTTLRGKITLDDADAAPPAAREVRVMALPVEFDSAPVGGGPAPSQTRDDLTFEVTHMSGVRRVLVSISSPRWALKSVTRAGIEVTDEPIDFREKDVDDVEVVLTPKVSRVSGSVSDDQGQPLREYTVIVFAADTSKWYPQSRSLATARPNQQGQFQFRALPPGDYFVVALANVLQFEWMDPEFLQAVRPLATSFTLAEGEAKTLTLTLKKRP
jgi:protocatechuate 3,4-dioxygenase beta subunit